MTEAKPQQLQQERLSWRDEVKQYVLPEIEEKYNLHFGSEDVEQVIDLLEKALDGENEDLRDSLRSYGQSEFQLLARINLFRKYILRKSSAFRIREAYTTLMSKKPLLVSYENKGFSLEFQKGMRRLYPGGNSAGPGQLLFGIYRMFAKTDEDVNHLSEEVESSLQGYAEDGELEPLNVNVPEDYKEKAEELFIEIESETGVKFPERTEALVKMILGIFFMSLDYDKETPIWSLELLQLIEWIGDQVVYSFVEKKKLRSQLNNDTTRIEQNYIFSNEHFSKIFNSLAINLGPIRNPIVFGPKPEKFKASFFEFMLGLYFIIGRDVLDIEDQIEKYIERKVLNTPYKKAPPEQLELF